MEKSLIINDDDRRKLEVMLDQGSKVLGLTVARLYSSANNEWIYIGTGCVTLTKDTLRKNYFLQLFNMDKSEKTLEFKVLYNSEYEKFKNQIHTAVFGNDIYLLSFADLNESDKFLTEVKAVIALKNERRQNRNSTNNRNGGISITSNIKSINTESRTSVADKKSINTNKKRVRKLSKSDISNPSNFKHLDHMGLDNHFFQNPQDENLKKFLKGSKFDHLLNDDKSKKEIYEFVENHGGFVKFENELKQQENRIRKPPALPNSVPFKNAPPPPPLPPNRPPPSQYVAPSHPPQSRPVAPANIGVSPPGPPVPAPPPPPPPPPPPVTELQLPKTAQNKPAVSTGDSRGGLLSEITKFDQSRLKASSQINPRPPLKNDDQGESITGGGGGSILESLAAYLQDRQNIMMATNSDDSENNDSEEEEDWND